MSALVDIVQKFMNLQNWVYLIITHTFPSPIELTFQNHYFYVAKGGVFMDRSDKVSKDVIKIFHNAKGSIFNDVLKWTQDLKDEHAIYSKVSNESTNKLQVPENRLMK